MGVVKDIANLFDEVEQKFLKVVLMLLPGYFLLFFLLFDSFKDMDVLNRLALPLGASVAGIVVTLCLGIWVDKKIVTPMHISTLIFNGGFIFSSFIVYAMFDNITAELSLACSAMFWMLSFFLLKIVLSIGKQIRKCREKRIAKIAQNVSSKK